ncbi:chemotaxis protein CheB [uncultured Roseibium sp.]|uniref:chemotaxis protein CheB n=1 Tax=uncultured Roseibium sp. TaxID=1936171 RepID=UPI003217C81F
MLDSSFPIVGVGASAGGLEALRQMFSGAAANAGMAFVVVQHLDPNHESMMAQLVERHSSMPVRQIVGGESIEADHVYIIPPGYGLALKDGVISLTEFSDPRGMRRPIDDFFESLALDRKAFAACVILSGTGADGSRGLRAIKEHGGICVVQEPESARYDGMPLSAVSTGLVDYVREPEAIVSTLKAYFDRRFCNCDESEHDAMVVADHVDDLCKSIRDLVGHDFSGYKRPTLTRRIARRMQVLGIEDAGEYNAKVRNNSEECSVLFRDLLINVTRFFRDGDVFGCLFDRVIRPMITARASEDEIRVWVPGCSSGEEAYSIAMLFAEATRLEGKQSIVQIFATDIDEQMLRIAREGSYPVAALADIPEDMRSRYTIGHGDTFTVTPAIRDMVRFSAHSLIKDPPFSRIDLISCRNLLIYLGDRLQQAVLPIFHYALRPEAYLLLGPSETIGRFDDLFVPIDQRNRLFRRNRGRPQYPLELPASPLRKRRHTIERPIVEDEAPNWVQGEALKRLTQAYGPPSLLLDHEGYIIANWGAIGRYLDFPGQEERRLSAPSLAKPGLREIMGALVREVQNGGKRRVARDVRVIADFGTQRVNVVCEPIRAGNLLMVIRELGPMQILSEEEMDELGSIDGQVQALEDELRMTRHRLRSTVEELETANEELKSSNEEMMSMNEELQSTNEELTTVNDELKTKVDQLTVANADLKNFFDSTQLAVVVLDKGLHIRSYTDAACEIFPFQPADRARQLSDVASSLEHRDFLEDAGEVISTGEARDKILRDQTAGRDYSLRIIPYRTLEGNVDGATLVFTDITEAMKLELELQEGRDRLELAIEVAGIGIWEYDSETGETFVDQGALDLFGLSGDGGSRIESLLDRLHRDDREQARELLNKAFTSNEDYRSIIRVPLDDGRVRWLRALGRVISKDGRQRLLGVSFDISAEHQILETRDLLLREMNHRIKNLFSVVSSLVTLGSRDYDTAGELADDLRGRLLALSQSHALTQVSGEAAPTDLGSLVRTVIAPSLRTQKFTISEDLVAVAAGKVTPLTLILHEWATNASKYGALSEPNGELEIRWKTRDGHVTLDWNERSEAIQSGSADDGERPVGFGTKLIDATICQLQGSLEGSQGNGFFQRRFSFQPQ